MGDADRFTQVFVNLLRNAVDAIGGDGSIVVCAEREQREGGSWVCLTVTDSGPGIDPGALARVFEPFATTRLDARGTGLGLAVSEGIVREHGGVLVARNSQDAAEGAVFEVLLPDGRRSHDPAGSATLTTTGATSTT